LADVELRVGAFGHGPKRGDGEEECVECAQKRPPNRSDRCLHVLFVLEMERGSLALSPLESRMSRLPFLPVVDPALSADSWIANRGQSSQFNYDNPSGPQRLVKKA
jgi:hypothetical protein